MFLRLRAQAGVLVLPLCDLVKFKTSLCPNVPSCKMRIKIGVISSSIGSEMTEGM